MAKDEQKSKLAAKGGDQRADGADKTPMVQVLGQYVKDLSFENPNAPRSFQPQKTQPTMNVDIDVEKKQVGEKAYEVTINLDCRLTSDAMALFHLELAYAGAFQIENVPEALRDQLLSVQGPTLLFPFVRRLVADVTRDGGFPPLYLEPIDFATLYQSKSARRPTGAASKLVT